MSACINVAHIVGHPIQPLPLHTFIKESRQVGQLYQNVVIGNLLAVADYVVQLITQTLNYVSAAA